MKVSSWLFCRTYSYGNFSSLTSCIHFDMPVSLNHFLFAHHFQLILGHFFKLLRDIPENTSSISLCLSENVFFFFSGIFSKNNSSVSANSPLYKCAFFLNLVLWYLSSSYTRLVGLVLKFWRIYTVPFSLCNPYISMANLQCKITLVIDLFPERRWGFRSWGWHMMSCKTEASSKTDGNTNF